MIAVTPSTILRSLHPRTDEAIPGELDCEQAMKNSFNAKFLNVNMVL